jgi:hypothetical protein
MAGRSLLPTPDALPAPAVAGNLAFSANAGKIISLVVSYAYRCLPRKLPLLWPRVAQSLSDFDE